MPTVSNRDLNGHWGERKSIGEDTLSSKRFKPGHEFNAMPDIQSSAVNSITEEHGYAVTQQFISSNSYYGYHPVLAHGHVDDCPMDRDEATAASGRTCETANWLVTRKRCFDGSLEADDGITVGKRVRYDSFQERLPPCDPSPPSYSGFPQAQQQQLPGNASYLMETLIPRPRCLMGHYV